MNASSVSWRHALASTLAVLLVLGAVAVVVRSDGLPAVDAASGRATRWFVHEPSGRVVLVDGYGGRALASLDAGTQQEEVAVAEGGPGAYVLNETTAEVRQIDSAELRLGSPFGLTTLGEGGAIASVGQAGLVVVDPAAGQATVLPADGEPIGFPVVAGDATVVGPDGVIWSLVAGDLRRTTSTSATSTTLGVDDGALSLVGNQPLVLDRDRARVRLGVDGAWQSIPVADENTSELVLQVAGPSASCGWVGADDRLWCLSTEGIEHDVTIPGLDIDGADSLAIAGDAAAVVRRGPSSIVRIDWRTAEILADVPTTVPSDATLQVTATVDLIWVDDASGNIVWAINPWTIEAIDKDPLGILVLGDDGDVVEEGASNVATAGGADSGSVAENERREPDDDGIDDPPVAIDDPVTARSGAAVQVQVTANDYDPDGEAIAVVDVGIAGHGTVDIGTATTVVYTPDPGYVGLDEFAYTIVDGNGTEASAAVIVELLPTDATNSPPLGVPDQAQTGAGVPVVIEVLLNDVDPERDSLRIGSYSPPDVLGGTTLGDVSETVGDTGLPALEFVPAEGFEGTAVFTYRPIDSLDAVGEDVEVRVEVARLDDANRPPLAQPDAVRVRRNVETPLLVLVNDVDPDGDVLALGVVEPLPDGLEVDVRGDQLAVTARAGADALVPFEYEIDDGAGHTARGAVLVDVIDDVEPNRPPVATSDTAKAVVGSSVIIDVTDNDVDPDGDPLVVTDVTQADGDRGQAVVFSDTQVQFSPAGLTDDEEQVNARFTYTISDGNGHEVDGEITVTVLPEALAEPPYARDDSTFTFVDVPVTVDVLRNDGDPSGGRPVLVGRPGCPSGGVAVVTSDGLVRFDPPAGRAGAFRCTYEVTNAQGLRASASIIVSVREPELTNEPPVVANDSLTVELGETERIDVTDNDSDPDGDDSLLEVVSSTAPSIGSAERRGNSIVFTAGQQVGVVSISYQVADAEGAVTLGRLVVRIIEPVNVAPIAIADLQTIFGPGVPTTFSVLSNDSDPDDTPGGLSVVSASLVSGDGSVSVAGDTVTLVPDPDLVGDLTATYTVADGEGLTATANVALTVLEPLNRPPDARDDAAEVNNGGTVGVAVLFNDTDPDGDELALSILGPPDAALGTVSVGGDQSITFVANPGASGTAIITYQVSDGELTDTAALRISVRPCSESAPVAGDSFVQTGYQQPVAVDLGALAANGTVTDVVAPPGFANGIYTPPAGENGNVQISYAVVNTCRLRATGTVTIDVNQDPVVRPTTVAAGRDDVRVVPVTDLATDREPLVIVDAPGAPSWVDVGADRLTISPTTAVPAGSYDFTARVSDPGGLGGAVPVTVTVTNRAPTAVADDVDVSSGSPASVVLAANDTDPDGPNSSLRVRSVPSSITFSDGSTGTVSLSADGRAVTVDPGAGLGTASFTYTVEDADGAVSAPATVGVTGPRLNTPPFARDQSVAATAGVARQVTLDAGDVDGDPVTVVDVDDPSGIVADRDGLTVTLLSSKPGSFTFTYRVNDGVAASPVATVTVVVEVPSTTTPPTTIPPTTIPPTTIPSTTIPPTTAPPTVPPATTVPPTTPPPAPTTTVL